MPHKLRKVLRAAIEVQCKCRDSLCETWQTCTRDLVQAECMRGTDWGRCARSAMWLGRMCGSGMSAEGLLKGTQSGREKMHGRARGECTDGRHLPSNFPFDFLGKPVGNIANGDHMIA